MVSFMLGDRQVTAHTGVLVSLQHKLCNTCVRIPELDTAVLGTTENPVTVGSEGNAKNEVLINCQHM